MNASPHDSPIPAASRYDIDPARDQLLALRRVPEWYVTRTRERVHRSAPYRWARRGIRGIALPTIRLGSVRYTSIEAISWWAAAVDGAAPVDGGGS